MHVLTAEQRLLERQTARSVHGSNAEHQKDRMGGAKAASDNFTESNSENARFCMEKEKQESCSAGTQHARSDLGLKETSMNYLC